MPSLLAGKAAKLADGELDAFGGAAGVRGGERPQFEGQGAAQIVGAGIGDAVGVEGDDFVAQIEAGGAVEFGLGEAFGARIVCVVVQFVEAAIVPGGEGQHHGVAAVAGGREGGGFGADVLQRVGADGVEGNLGHQGAGGRMPVKRRSAGPQLKSPVPFGGLGGGVDQQLGVEADLISVEAVRVG